MKAQRMIVKTLSVSLLLSFSLHLKGQIRMEPTPPPKHITTEEEKAREQTRWMQRNLDLELDQFMKINNINLTYARRLDSLDKAVDKHVRTDYKQELRKRKEAELKDVLSQEQYKQYLAHREKPNSQKKSPFVGSY